MSDVTDQVEHKRRKMIEYNSALADFKIELDEKEGSLTQFKREKILALAKILEDTGFDKEKISAQLSHDLKGKIDSSWIRKNLGDEFKNKSMIREENCGINPANEQDQKKQPILIANNGSSEVIDQNPEKEINEIYGGKSFSQMKREADNEIAEDKEETLENPANGPKTVFLSDKSPEFRELEAKFDEAQDMISKMAEDRDTAIQQAKIWSKKFNQLKGGSMSEDLVRLKVENNNLKTLMADIDKTAIQEEGYKEVEIYKLVSERVSWLLQTSKSSQRTLFLLVNPKTMEIKSMKTDVEMHQIQAKRAAGVQ